MTIPVLPAALLHYDRLPVGGRWRPAHPGADRIQVINPATEQVIGSCPAASPMDVHLAAVAARTAFDEGPWPRMTHAERAAVLLRAADLYAARMPQMSALITAQTGSPASFTAQVEHPAAILRYYADLSYRYPWNELREGQLEIWREPVGVVAAIVPWNMPQKTIMMKVAPALLAGCTVVIKPAPETPLDALLLADILDEAGIPGGVVNVVPALPEVAEKLVTHAAVDKVAFTGSTATGRRIASWCARDVRRVSLELGGKSPALVFPDTDPAKVVRALRTDTFLLSGQICSAHTRVLVPMHQLAEYTTLIAEMAESLLVGDPTDYATEVGPLVAFRQQRRVQTFIKDAIAGGVPLVTGGHTNPRRNGWYVTPTVFDATDHPNSAIAREEIFGPVVTLIGYDGEEHGIELANDSSYGLEAAVWTGDKARAVRVTRALRAGTVRINGAAPGIHAPLGGYKTSGIGRELGPEGLAGYLETKAVTGRL